MLLKVIKNTKDAQLKEWNKLCVAIAIAIVFDMAAMVGLSHFQITVQVESAWISGIGPSLLLPFIFIPLLISSGIQKERNNRKNATH